MNAKIRSIISDMTDARDRQKGSLCNYLQINVPRREETCLLHASNKGADQLAHPQSDQCFRYSLLEKFY